MELDAGTRAKFDAVLDRVKDPQSLLSLAELGLVSKFTYSAKEKAIVVKLDAAAPRFECPACSAMMGELIQGIERMLREELQVDFPGFRVEYE